MTEGYVITFSMNAILVALTLLTPFLLVSLVIGSIISLLQAATQVNEVTLTFVPKIIGMVAVILLLGGWMLQQIISYTSKLFQSLPSLVH
jgi:flagellar biosynthetic protein FliQ